MIARKPGLRLSIGRLLWTTTPGTPELQDDEEYYGCQARQPRQFRMRDINERNTATRNNAGNTPK